MSREYWDTFMATGSVEDYLRYRESSIDSERVDKWEVKSWQSEGTDGESDGGDRNGVVREANWRV